jgi:hypothetical protein
MFKVKVVDLDPTKQFCLLVRGEKLQMGACWVCRAGNIVSERDGVFSVSYI